MATVVLATSGTAGDLYPFLALGRVLRERGHTVRIAACPSFLPHIQDAGLIGFPCRPDLNPVVARQFAPAWDFWNKPSRGLVDPRRLCLKETFSDLMRACSGADIFICSPIQFIGDLIHEASGIPWLTTAVTPAHFAPSSLDADNSTTSGTHRRGLVGFDELMTNFRNQLRLPSLPLKAYQRVRFSQQIILGVDPLFCVLDKERYPGLTTTGFWFYDRPAWSGWRPAQELRYFMERQPAPLVLTFSSLPTSNPEKVVRIHAEATARLGRRLLIQRGWAGFSEEHLPPGTRDGLVMFAEEMPHDWLFSHAAAVIHHGGIGTTASALKCGCPMLIEPYGNDQHYNARQVLRLGAGASAHPHKLTGANLAWLLEEKVLAPECRENVRTLQEEISSINGLDTACQIIEEYI